MRARTASFELIVLAETFRFSSGWNLHRWQMQTSLPYRWDYLLYHCSMCLKSRGNFYWGGVWAYLEVLKKEEKMLHAVCCKMCPVSNVQNKWAVSFFSSIDAAPSEQLRWGGDVTGQHGKQMLMAITQTPCEPSMGACQGLLNHSLKTTRVTHTQRRHTETRRWSKGSSERMRYTSSHLHTENGSLSPAGFQTDKLSVCR